MSEEIRKLAPKEVWENFYQLTQIPRPSKKEAAVIAFAKKFGEDLGLKTIVDEVGNVIIKKPATPGMENRMGVILQSHLDMVPQANSTTNHDFEKDPIDAYIDGEWVTARDTTLGADNGMGVAATLAVLQAKDLQHGPIEALFTIDEETGMTGAFGLKPGLFDGDILMNLDSEDEGELYVGCAGGEDANVTFKCTMEAIPKGYEIGAIAVTGLKGGHSGMDIILGRGNANVILFRLLKQLEKQYSIRIASINGGSLRNALPREAFVTYYAPEGKKQNIESDIKKFEAIIVKELSGTEPTLGIATAKPSIAKNVIDAKTQSNLINAILACPNGVIRMSDSMPGLVETSINLAIVKSDNDKIYVQCLMRSSVDTARDALAQSVKSVFDLAGAEIKFEGGYPGWKPNMASPILKTMMEIYNKKFGKVPEIKAIHAGLECGLLGGVYPNWDMISFGPTIRFPHSPDEKVKIDTVQKFWDFLKETLKNVPVK
ncbi:MAG: aminoacyl-histidine dipeptidase [Salinivirgaceae bacterium]|nr:aminoacyl-histidine dipeptidase [Salinivirgaceae bacterium]MDY0279653.1 aminoacyl-histidine dipeptidase [Salinivirgaceae bacterium]